MYRQHMHQHLARRSFLRSIFAVSGFVFSTPLMPTQAEAAPKGQIHEYGFSMYGGNVALSPADLERELQAVSMAGATWLRVIFDSFRIEESRGSFNWDYQDLVLDSANQLGLNVLVTVSYSQSWALPAGAAWSSPPTDVNDFASFAQAAVSRYSEQVNTWEIWNEPNTQHYFSYDGNNASRYADLLKAAYAAIKDVQPFSTVLTAGLSPTASISPPAFLQGLYDAGAQGYFDGVGAHPYVWPGGLAADPNNAWSDVGRMHAIMSSYGDGEKKIWLTELGAPTTDGPPGVSESEQAEQIVDVLQAAATTSYIGPSFIFTIRDAPGRDNQIDYNFGALLTAGWRPKVCASVLPALRGS